MKSLFKTYKRILAESQTSDCIRLFGKELFGDMLGGKERDTPIESKYSDEIRDFTDNMYGEETTPELIQAIDDLSECVSEYPEILEPENKTLYRGTYIPLEYFYENKILIEPNPLPYSYYGYSQIQSWTDNFLISKEFGDNNHINDMAINLEDYKSVDDCVELLRESLADNLKLAHMMVYNGSKGDFLFKSRYFNLLSYTGDEDEVLRINNGPIKVNAHLKYGGTLGLNSNGEKFIELLNIGIKNI